MTTFSTNTNFNRSMMPAKLHNARWQHGCLYAKTSCAHPTQAQTTCCEIAYSTWKNQCRRPTRKQAALHDIATAALSALGSN
jgi:hypothetical protein